MKKRREDADGGKGAVSRSAVNDMPALQCGLEGPAGRRAALFGELENVVGNGLELVLTEAETGVGHGVPG